MISFELTDLRPKRHPPVPKKKLLEYLNTAFQSVDLPDGFVDLSIVDDSRIRKYNREFRGIDRPTNVLSFPLYHWQKPLLPADVLRAGGSKEPPLIYGSILISPETVLRESMVLNKGFLEHFLRLGIHATLHLLGFEHDTDDQEKEMILKEELIVDYINRLMVIRNGL